MPASQRSLELTDRYRARLLAIGSRVEHQAQVLWPSIEELDRTNWSDRMATILTAAQAEAVRVSAGYLSAFLSTELGRPTQGPPLSSRDYSGVSRDGRPLSESLRSPLIGVLSDLKVGKPADEALRDGLNRAKRTVGFEAVQAGRDAALAGIDGSEQFIGFQRAVAGTCAACMALSGDPVSEVHPGCECVTEPIVRANEGRLTANDRVDSGPTLDSNLRSQVADFFNARAPKAEGRLSSELRDVANRWQGFDSELPNQRMRQGRAVFAHDLEFVKSMDRLMDAVGSAGRNFQAYRGIPLESLDVLGDIEGLVGKVFTDPGFVATTPLKGQAVQWSKGAGVFAKTRAETIWNLTVSRDVQALWEEAASPIGSVGTQEIVLQRGCRFVITKVEKTPKGNYRIDATVLPPVKKPPLPKVEK